ncbi:hypothetical protein MHTCC0001_17020 [Flavobacteriaceae bacterium MHTCC 0001]
MMKNTNLFTLLIFTCLILSCLNCSNNSGTDDTLEQTDQQDPKDDNDDNADDHNHNHDNDDDDDNTDNDGDSDDLISEDTTVFAKDEDKQIIVDNFNTAIDMIDLGTASIHNQIPIDTDQGLKFDNLFNDNFLLIKNVFLHDLSIENFRPISDAHLQQDLSAALAWENGEALIRPNTIYIRSHEQNLVESVAFNANTDKINFMYLSVRGDNELNFSVEQTQSGVRFFSPISGQSITLLNTTFNDLKSEHFQWRANQLEDNIADRIGLSPKIADFKIIETNVFSGKSIANAGRVDKAPYHQYNYSKYTGTPRRQDSNFEN